MSNCYNINTLCDGIAFPSASVHTITTSCIMSSVQCYITPQCFAAVSCKVDCYNITTS